MEFMQPDPVLNKLLILSAQKFLHNYITSYQGALKRFSIHERGLHEDAFFFLLFSKCVDAVKQFADRERRHEKNNAVHLRQRTAKKKRGVLIYRSHHMLFFWNRYD